MRNFTLLNAYPNKADAWNAWKKQSTELKAAGYTAQVQQYQPPENADFRQIAQCIATLTEASEVARGHVGGIKPLCPVCGSLNINQYKMPYGPMWCMECGFRVEEKNDQPNPFMSSGLMTGTISRQGDKRDG